MPFDTGIATDKINLLDKLRDFITSNHVATAAISAGGTGYTVGDILTATGGTFFTAATFEVLTVAAGVVTALKLIKSGAYTSNPSSPVSTTGGTGTGATVTVTFTSAEWSVMRQNQEALSATVQAGGTGYTVNDVLTVVGGTLQSAAAQFIVTAVSGGVVTTVGLQTKGSYKIIPANPVSTTGGGGSGATLNVTWQAQLQASVEKDMIFKGLGSGSDEIYVGVRTYVSTGHNWELAGMTGYQAASLFGSQPGVSPGRWDLSEDGHYVPLSNGTITYWFFATGRRIVAVFKIGTSYPSMYLGWLDPFGTQAEYPYPLLVMASNSKFDQVSSSTTISNSGISDPISEGSSSVNGPGSIRDPMGNWRRVENGNHNAGARSVRDDLVVFPSGEPMQTGIATVDDWATSTFDMNVVIPNTGVPGTPTVALWPTPDSPSNVSSLWPCILIERDPDQIVLGEMNEVFWVHAQGESTNLVAEDLVQTSLADYIVFQCTNRSDSWAHFAVKRG